MMQLDCMVMIVTSSSVFGAYLPHVSQRATFVNANGIVVNAGSIPAIHSPTPVKVWEAYRPQGCEVRVKPELYVEASMQLSGASRLRSRSSVSKNQKL